MAIQALCCSSRMALQTPCLHLLAPDRFSPMISTPTFPPSPRRRPPLSLRRWIVHSPCFCAVPSFLEAEPPASHHRSGLALDIGSAVIPHPEKVEKGGEDAFFISDFNGGVLGVADGVSGWAEENVDPALFSRELMQHALAAVGKEEVGNCPRKIMEKADEATSAIGAATAIIVTLASKDGILRIANLGDCGLRLLREGKIIFATATQQHYFDCPYQLSSEKGAQKAKDAKMYEIDVQDGDVIIVGSDGLFDNVYDKDIEILVAPICNSEMKDAQGIATAVASLASKNANDSKYESPYSREAIFQGYDLPLWKKILGQKLTGGKLDDITVLAALVVNRDIIV